MKYVGKLVGIVTILLLAHTMTWRTSTAETDHVQFATMLDATIKEWMLQHHVKAASLAVLFNGQIVGAYSHGGMDANVPTRVASLSKAITGVCIARLIDEGRLSFSSSMGKIFANALPKFQPVDASFQSITIEQILIHRGGLIRELPRTVNEPKDLSEMFRRVLAAPLES
jgi:CubicO group peptidase (beta-lactamase class C family)